MEVHSRPNVTKEFKEICVAADLLRKMFVELQNHAIHNSHLNFAMATNGHTVQQRLHILQGITDMVHATQDGARANALIQKARSITTRLTEEMEDLAIKAGHEFECIE
jgi:hypothetical protein